jgi:transposase
MKVKLVGIDLAKSVFQVCVIALRGGVLFNKKMGRAKLILWLKDLEPTTIAMEACATANYWGRKLQAAGHTVRLIPAQHVKAFCRVHKTDSGDALAIVEAAQRPNIHFVPVKTIGQQDLQVLSRVRSKLVSQRSELICQIRGLASEYGLSFPISRAALMAGLPLVLEDAENELTPVARSALSGLFEDIKGLDGRLSQLALDTAELANQEPAYARLLTVPGYGPVVAPAFIAAVGAGKQFRQGRDVSAWLGVVPKQHGTGGKVAMMRITKNGDRSLRTLLIHGARSVMNWASRRDDAMGRWIMALKARRGAARTIVALANKLARIGWAVLQSDQPFDLNKAFRPKRMKSETPATA